MCVSARRVLGEWAGWRLRISLPWQDAPHWQHHGVPDWMWRCSLYWVPVPTVVHWLGETTFHSVVWARPQIMVVFFRPLSSVTDLFHHSAQNPSSFYIYLLISLLGEPHLKTQGSLYFSLLAGIKGVAPHTCLPQSLNFLPSTQFAVWSFI